MAIIKRLLPYQNKLIKAPLTFPFIRYFFLICGYGAGKTSSLVDSLNYWVDRLQGKRDKEGRKPLITLCAPTLTFMKKTCVHDFLQALDNTETQYVYHKDINQIEIGDVTIILQPVEDPSQIYGFNTCAIFWDEQDELPTEVSVEALRALNERLRQQLIDERPPFLVSTSTAQGKKGLYMCIEAFKKSGIGYMIIRGKTKDNIYLPEAYVKSMYSMYNEKERRCYLEGEFISVDSGMVFPDYDPTKNDLDEDLWDCLDENEKVYVGADFNSFGYAHSAWIVKNGAVICIKDYNFPDIRRAPETLRYDFPIQKIYWIPDMTYKEHFSNFKKELRANRINIVPRACNPKVSDRNFAINKLLYAERLFICPIATRVKDTLKMWQMDKRTGQPTKGGEGAVDHIGDTMGYAVHYLLSWHKELKDAYDVTLGRLYRFKADPSVSNGNQIVSGLDIESYTRKSSLGHYKDN